MNPAAEVYEVRFAVKPADIDRLDHVNNVVYVRWVQDTAVAHWRARADAESQANVLWVLVRHEIDYKQPAKLGDEIVARTWVGEATRATWERFVELRRAADDTLLARSRTVWCPVDAQTRRPVKIAGALREVFTALAAPAEH